MAFVHMGPAGSEREIVERYGVADVPCVSDPQRVLYRAFGLRRAMLQQVLGLRQWWRAIRVAFGKGHGLSLQGREGLQMPGVFLLHRGRVLRSFYHQNTSDRPDYAGMAGADGSD